MNTFRSLLLLFLLAPCSYAMVPLYDAGENGPVRRAVESFLSNQIKGLPGKAGFKIGPISTAHSGDACERLDVGMAPNARPWGRTHVLVRCSTGNGQKWSLFIPVQINVSANYLVSARPVSSGQILTENDLQWMAGDLGELPAGTLTDASQVVGQVLTVSLPAGRPLRSDMMRQPTLVQQGQSVKVLTTGAGFQAANEGKALNNAGLGQVAQIRLPSGAVVSGQVRSDGAVDIKF